MSFIYSGSYSVIPGAPVNLIDDYGDPESQGGVRVSNQRLALGS